MSEQRRHARYKIAVAAEVVVGGETLVASTQDLSLGGVGLVLDRALREKTIVGVMLFLTQDGIEDPDEEPFEAKAMVMWVAERDDGTRGVGVQFAALSPAQRQTLERFLGAIA